MEIIGISSGLALRCWNPAVVAPCSGSCCCCCSCCCRTCANAETNKLSRWVSRDLHRRRNVWTHMKLMANTKRKMARNNKLRQMTSGTRGWTKYVFKGSGWKDSGHVLTRLEQRQALWSKPYHPLGLRVVDSLTRPNYKKGSFDATRHTELATPPQVRSSQIFREPRVFHVCSFPGGPPTFN
jgi:hypothetical protein